MVGEGDAAEGEPLGQINLIHQQDKDKQRENLQKQNPGAAEEDRETAEDRGALRVRIKIGPAECADRQFVSQAEAA